MIYKIHLIYYKPYMMQTQMIVLIYFELIYEQNTLPIRIMTVCCSERIKSFWQKLPSWDFTNHYIMHMPPLKSEWGNDSMYIAFLASCCLARIILVTQFSLLHDKESLINYYMAIHILQITTLCLKKYFILLLHRKLR